MNSVDDLNNVYDYSNWMYKQENIIYKRPINKIYFPGADNAGMYSINFNRYHENASKTTKFIVNMGRKHKIIRNHVNSWYLRNRGDIYTQLTRGIRYLDLQYAVINNKFYFSNVYIGPGLKEGLSDVREFLEDHPYEIIIINLRPDPEYEKSITVDNLIQLYRVLKKKLGTLLSPKQNSSFKLPTYHDMIESNQRVILFMDYQEYYSMFLKKKYVWSPFNLIAPDTKTIDYHDKVIFLKDSIKLLMAKNNTPNFNVIRATIHPKPSNIRLGLLQTLRLNTRNPTSFNYYNNRIQNEALFIIDQPFYMKRASVMSFHYPSYTHINKIIRLNELKFYNTKEIPPPTPPFQQY
jgi:hypothetical protein